MDQIIENNTKVNAGYLTNEDDLTTPVIQDERDEKKQSEWLSLNNS